MTVDTNANATQQEPNQTTVAVADECFFLGTLYQTIGRLDCGGIDEAKACIDDFLKKNASNFAPESEEAKIAETMKAAFKKDDVKAELCVLVAKVKKSSSSDDEQLVLADH